MHCNSSRTACFVILEHFVFTITTAACALPIANRRWGRVARVSHALCSQIQVFPTWRIVFLYSLCLLFVFVFSDWGPIVSCFTHFVSHSVPDTPCFEKQAIQMSLTYQCFSVRIRKSNLRKSYLMSFFWSGTSSPSFFFTYPLYFCQMYECLNSWHILSHSELELIVFFCDTQLITINFNWSTFCAWVWLEALTERRKAPHIAWYQTRVF